MRVTWKRERRIKESWRGGSKVLPHFRQITSVCESKCFSLAMRHKESVCEPKKNKRYFSLAVRYIQRIL